jgi:hypothetical protein
MLSYTSTSAQSTPLWLGIITNREENSQYLRKMNSMQTGDDNTNLSITILVWIIPRQLFRVYSMNIVTAGTQQCMLPTTLLYVQFANRRNKKT